jgi:lipid-binding SYLF domain-containing protein
MRVLIALCLVLGCTVSARAIDKPELDKRLGKLRVKLETLQSKSDKRIPAQTLRKAQGIVLLDRTKAGFIFAYQGGGGVAMVKDAKSGKWGAPAFLSANEASLGFQIGGQQSFVVVLLMTTNAVLDVVESNFQFGGEASGTAGNSSGKAEGNLTPDVPMVVYTDAEGLYGGAAIKGGSVSTDNDANAAYYGQVLTAKDILFDKKGQPSQAAVDLAKKITEYSK